MQSRTQSPKSMSLIGFDVELLGQLSVNSFYQLPNNIEQSPYFAWQLLLLITTPQGSQADAIVFPQLVSFLCADVSLVANHIQVSVFCQQLKANLKICGIRVVP